MSPKIIQKCTAPNLKIKSENAEKKLEDLAHDIKSLARYANPNVSPETREQPSRFSVLCAKLEWNVYQGKLYSLQHAVTLELECEAHQNGRKQRSNLKYNRSMNEVQYNGLSQSLSVRCEASSVFVAIKGVLSSL